MAYLVRKFHRPKWEPNKIVPKSVDELSADALTSCLRTSGNTLSVWKTESPEWGAFDDVLAAMFSTLDGPSRADIIVLKESELQQIEGIELEENEGKTPAVNEINAKHRDISNLRHSSITCVAKIFLEELAKGQKAQVKRYSEKNTIKLVKYFIDQGKIDKDQLTDRWLEKL
ncbi:MAG: hypothetical protein ACQEXI_06125 [Pseudomonadota bacterium]